MLDHEMKINPNKPSELSHHYQLDESTFILGESGVIFHFYFIFLGLFCLCMSRKDARPMYV